MRKRLIMLGLLLTGSVLLSACGKDEEETDALVLKVCNWEEYMDLGDWDDEETIESLI